MRWQPLTVHNWYILQTELMTCPVVISGAVYLFVPAYAEEQDNWKSDQYRWLNYGSKDIPKRDPLVKKLFFVGKNPDGKTNKFQRHVYTSVSYTHLTLPTKA